MKFLRLDLLTLLISLFILNSCRNESTIGLGVTSSTQLNSTMIDTATIVVNTVPEDSVVTSGLTKNALGYFQDPVLGTTEANIAVALNLPNQNAYSLPTGTVTVDSAVLVLKYADGFYGDSLTSRYKINVYQLAERPLNQTYFNTKSWNYNNTIVGTRSFYARTHDSVKIYDIITGAPDTLKRVGPQLRVPIDKNFINTILFNASSAQLSSNTVFLNNVKGLYLTLDKSGTTGPGGTFMFSLADSLNVYYRANNGTTIDTATVSLPLSSTHAVQIKRTPSTAVTTELANTTGGSRDVIYFQGLAGLKAKISFPYLKSIIKTIGSRIVINKAELVITPVPGSNIPYNAQPKLTMYRYDIAHTLAELPDASSNDARSGGIGVFGGYYSPSLKNYHFTVTAYIQDLMDGKTIDYGTYIAPVDTTNTQTVDIAPTPQTGGRTIAVGTDKTSPYRIKLNITYTKINN
ncbi:DUF4270 family protein [Mucilaginibacter sp.]|uniref:DUF4270 family protein n=1 Tax=Mucilaginibacter sp. TaxID=1882438 RepID=UPI002C171C74|nr:DUF4270 family protein [Mucilaginibacter sp.]HTI60458.1 DUF4270 family protein [Mucilaginibacter sp.]